jgi:disulfide oxidoreductase YuzD
MAALDLCAEMIKMSETQKIEEALERRICSAFVKHLTDSSLDVQTNAVKSIQNTASIIKEQNLIMIVDTLANMVIDAGNKEVRDIYSLAIQSTINELKEASAINMIRTVYPKLLKGLKSGKPEVQEECLEILAQIFKKFGQLLHKNNNLVNKDELMKTLCEML